MGAVILQGDEVLVVERGNEPWRGWWSLPGGVVETGETLREAVQRETREETGLDVVPLETVEIFESIAPRVDGECAYHYVVVDFLCRIEGGQLGAADDARAVRWFSRHKLPDNLTPGAADVIGKAFRLIESR